MANDGLVLDHAGSGTVLPRWMVEAAFVALLLLVFVGLTPFEKPPTGAAALVPASGGGDALRQVIYVGVFAFLGIVAYMRRALSALTVVPVSLLLVLGWAFLSATWSFVPDVTLRRAGLEFIVVASVMLGVDSLGPRRCLELLRYVLIGVLIVNWISIPIIPQARHLPGEADPALVGNWRGLYFHKNIAGAVEAITAMILLYFAIIRRSRIDFLLFLLAVGFTVMSRSKASLGFLPMAAGLGLVYGWGWKRDLDRWIVTLGGVLAVILAVTYVTSHAGELARKLDNPTEFTGRSAIWQAELDFIADHPFLGAGYGTFADTGKKSPLAPYVDDEWVERVSHGHNGYLQLMVTTGLIGFALAMFAFVILPFVGFWRRRPGEDLALKALLFALFCFSVFHNLLETDYMESDGPTWFVLLLLIGMLRAEPADTADRTGGTSWQAA